MNLTAKQEKFCQGVASGLTQSDAYRAAYDADKMKDETIQSKASVLMRDGKIAARVDSIRAPVVEAARITLQDHLTDLKALRDKADEANQFGAAIKAEESRGKASGLYVERKIIQTGPLDSLEAKELNELHDALATITGQPTSANTAGAGSTKH